MRGTATDFLRAIHLVAILLLLGCAQTESTRVREARAAVTASIQTEPAGDYFIGRRYYKAEYKFWGYVRRPRQPWSIAQLVVLNENEKLAPDRERRPVGSDNDYEYQLYGSFSGRNVYETRSDGVYPEFILRRYRLISERPLPIFRSQYDARAAVAAKKMLIEKPDEAR